MVRLGVGMLRQVRERMSSNAPEADASRGADDGLGSKAA
jgi:hypothetical protein